MGTQDQPLAAGNGATASRGLLYLALAVALVPFAFLVHRFDFLCDDAFITFRYSRNLAEGLGLVYNPPQLEAPVEGYSEFLWAGLMALGMKVGASPELASRALSVLAGVLMVAGLVRAIVRRYPDSPAAVLTSSLLLGSAPPLAVWSTGGMATMPTAALAVALFLVAHGAPAVDWRRRALLLGLISAGLTLMRADAALLVALVLSPPILTGLFRKDEQQWRPALAAAATGALVFLGHMAWRYSVYGDWVPNTARVKLGFSGAAAGRGLDYVVSAWLSMPGLALITLGALAGAWCSRRRWLRWCSGERPTPSPPAVTSCASLASWSRWFPSRCSARQGRWRGSRSGRGRAPFLRAWRRRPSRRWRRSTFTRSPRPRGWPFTSGTTRR